MEIDLASFLAPAGSLLGDVTQRVLEFLSVQDLVQYVATSNLEEDNSSSSSSIDSNCEARSSTKISQQQNPTDAAGGLGYRDQGFSRRSAQDDFDGGYRDGARRAGSSTSPEEEPPRRASQTSSARGGGDEAGGRSRAPTPRRAANRGGVMQDHPPGGERSWDDREYGLGNHEGIVSASGGGGGVDVVVVGRNEKDSADSSFSHNGGGRRRRGGGGGKGVISALGFVIGLGLHPWTALGAIRGGVAHLLGDLLGGVPLLAFLRWAAGGASAVLGLSFRVALLPYDVTKGVVSYVVGSLEAMLTIATEVRHDFRVFWWECRQVYFAEVTKKQLRIILSDHTSTLR